MRDLQRVDMETLSETERLCFFLNLYNAMVIHAIITIGQPGLIDRRAFFADFQYIVGGYPYSLSTIKNGILRSNRRQPYSFIKPFSSTDNRLKVPDLICHLFVLNSHDFFNLFIFKRYFLTSQPEPASFDNHF